MTKFKVTFELTLDTKEFQTYIEDHILSYLDKGERIDNFKYEKIEENVVISDDED
jgi:hypothetical protein